MTSEEARKAMLRSLGLDPDDVDPHQYAAAQQATHDVNRLLAGVTSIHLGYIDDAQASDSIDDSAERFTDSMDEIARLTSRFVVEQGGGFRLDQLLAQMASMLGEAFAAFRSSTGRVDIEPAHVPDWVRWIEITRPGTYGESPQQ